MSADEVNVVEIAPCTMSDDEVLKYTQGVRKELVKDLTFGGMPTAEENRKLLLATLKDMDSNALGNKKIKVEEKVGMSQANANALVAEVLRVVGNGDAFVIEGSARTAPSLPDTIGLPNLVPGETDINAKPISYENFAPAQEED